MSNPSREPSEDEKHEDGGGGRGTATDDEGTIGRSVSYEMRDETTNMRPFNPVHIRPFNPVHRSVRGGEHGCHTDETGMKHSAGGLIRRHVLPDTETIGEIEMSTLTRNHRRRHNAVETDRKRANGRR